MAGGFKRITDYDVVLPADLPDDAIVYVALPSEATPVLIDRKWTWANFKSWLTSWITSHSDVEANTTHRGVVEGNPHDVTKSEVGLSAVPNTDFTTPVSNNTDHRGLTDDPHDVTKTQVGLSAVPNTDFTSAVADNTAHKTRDGSEHSDVVTNNGKVTNANHTGDVTGSAELTIGALKVATGMVQNDAVTYTKMQNVVLDERLLGRVSGANGVVEELTNSQVRTMLGLDTNDEVTFGIVNCPSINTGLGDFEAYDQTKVIHVLIASAYTMPAMTVGQTVIVGVSISSNTSYNIKLPSGGTYEWIILSIDKDPTVTSSSIYGTGGTATAGETIMVSGDSTVSTNFIAAVTKISG